MERKILTIFDAMIAGMRSKKQTSTNRGLL